MIKKNLKTVVITSVITMLPMLLGIVLWNKLPDTLPTHWNIAGEVDGRSSKPFAVVFLPLLMLVIHLVCTVATSFDPKNKEVNPKIFTLVLWICPILSVVCMASTYAASLGVDVNVGMIIPLIIGILFLIIGNYLPKCKQNYTIGIKIPWTLNNEDNWNKTHRLAGFVWTISSLVIIVGAFFRETVVFTTFIPIAVMVFVPVIYSYIYYRKHR